MSEKVKSACVSRGAALMAVLNVTPDSFYDGGRYATQVAIEQRIEQMIAQGADIVDIGAESTRPGAPQISAAEQLDRARPAISAAKAQGMLISIDTTSAEVAAEAIACGAHMVNDVSLLSDPALPGVVAASETVLIAMHNRGLMAEMPGFSNYADDGYEDVVADVRGEWLAARDRALGLGVAPSRIWFDPGLGFYKNAQHSTELLARLAEFSDLGHPIVVGASRKSFLGALDDSPPDQRLASSLIAATHAVAAGASVLRVHDVRETAQALLAARALSSCTKVRSSSQKVLHA